MFTKSIRSLFVIIVVVLFALVLVGCGMGEGTPVVTETVPSTNSIDSLDIESYHVVSVKEKYQEASILAQDWHEDALLFRVDARIYDPHPPSKEGLYFIFESPTDRRHSLVVFCDFNECESKIYGLNGSFLELEIDPIKIDEIKIDSIEAAQTALRYGGAYVKRGKFHWRVTLIQGKDGTFQWEAYFIDEIDGRTIVFIDPYSGEVLEISN
jgi:hypothetical protein